MTDTLTKAKELIERFIQRSEPKGNEETDKFVIPEMKWEGIWKPKAEGVVVIRDGTRMIEPWTDARLGLAVRSPEMLTIIKDLLERFEKTMDEMQKMISNLKETEGVDSRKIAYSSGFIKAVGMFKQQLAELEGGE